MAEALYRVTLTYDTNFPVDKRAPDTEKFIGYLATEFKTATNRLGQVTIRTRVFVPTPVNPTSAFIVIGYDSKNIIKPQLSGWVSDARANTEWHGDVDIVEP